MLVNTTPDFKVLKHIQMFDGRKSGQSFFTFILKLWQYVNTKAFFKIYKICFQLSFSTSIYFWMKYFIIITDTSYLFWRNTLYVGKRHVQSLEGGTILHFSLGSFHSLLPFLWTDHSREYFLLILFSSCIFYFPHSTHFQKSIDMNSDKSWRGML